MSTLIPARAYAAARDLSTRQVQRYADAGRLPGAVKTPGGAWLIPDDVPHPQSVLAEIGTAAPSRDVAHVVPAPTAGAGGVIPAGLWPLEDVARFYGTTVGRIRVMGAHPRSPFVVGRYGPPDDYGHATWRVWVL